MATKKPSKTSPEETAKTVQEKREALRVFRFQVTGGRVKNVKEGRELRRDIARLLTAQVSQ